LARKNQGEAAKHDRWSSSGVDKDDFGGSNDGIGGRQNHGLINVGAIERRR